ncbi:hypothetical protein JCM19275_1990 [Nonlabens ulvanivorans]|uniref:Uncharacterized protein n=1 Tax=Nonlabens ulvanivorans TaxID=906888 RepID=A0A090WJI1_NONUL|nr:hypothetical protein JCM19275_1990 [Nonlabens ulvanivorans]
MVKKICFRCKLTTFIDKLIRKCFRESVNHTTFAALKNREL